MRLKCNPDEIVGFAPTGTAETEQKEVADQRRSARRLAPWEGISRTHDDVTDIGALAERQRRHYAARR